MANQSAGLHRLVVSQLTRHRTERGIEFFNAAHGADLRQLGGQFVVLQRVGRVLVFQLRNEQRQKATL
ncbi:hypothetical protein D3C75_861600 [compost metagenome]